MALIIFVAIFQSMFSLKVYFARDMAVGFGRL
jgi:hypothetical protein